MFPTVLCSLEEPILYVYQKQVHLNSRGNGNILVQHSVHIALNSQSSRQEGAHHPLAKLALREGEGRVGGAWRECVRMECGGREL